MGPEPNQATQACFDKHVVQLANPAEGMRKSVQVLVEHGARHDLKDRWGDTAAACAEKSGHADMKALL